MKIKLYTLAMMAGFVFAGCQDELDKMTPKGSALNLEQVKEGAELSTDRAQAGLPGMYAQLTAREGIFRIQGDFGYPSFVCRLEHAGDNVVSTTQGYNWFSNELVHRNFQVKNSYVSIWAWNASYKNIKLANDIIASNKDLAEDEKIRPVLGQAYAMRAWDYFLLAQVFGKNYKGNESTECVPITTEDTKPAEFSNNPRKSVQEVYDFILTDLDKAVELLKGFSPVAKNAISEGTAYGLRCRVNMVMNRWKEAAADAKKAIEVSKAAPFTIADCSIPNFDKIENAKNAMWGIIITPEDGVTKSTIANFTSMFTSLSRGSLTYTAGVGTYKMINTRVWEKISDTDIRKDWWTYEPTPYGYTSKLLHNAYGKTNVLGAGNDEMLLSKQLLPYTVVKFAPTEKSLTNKYNSNDFYLMRVEEMYYNLTESLAMSGDMANANKVLTEFVKTYRDPEYDKQFATAKELQDEVYFQKRIEFFGEGISWFDMKRMDKGIDRVDVATKNSGGYPTTTRFNVPAGDPTFTFQIPLAEEQANEALKGHNNPPFKSPKDLF